MAGPCWPCGGALVPRALPLPGLLCSVCVRSVCVYTAVAPILRSRGRAVPECSKLPGCLIDIFLGGRKVTVSCCTV